MSYTLLYHEPLCPSTNFGRLWFGSVGRTVARVAKSSDEHGEASRVGSGGVNLAIALSSNR